MSSQMLFFLDLVAISVLTFGLYFPRHRRRDLLVAYLVVNVGVMAVASALGSTEAAAGLGLGLFGVLSIIRLRSSELDQHEVAYYFAALSLGLLSGLAVTPVWLTPALMAVIVGVVYIADHPNLYPRYRQQNMVIDRAFTDEALLVAHLQALLSAKKIHQVRVRKVDLVHDTTSLEVRYEVPRVSGISDSAAPVGPSRASVGDKR